jgi:hypothetical protein
MCILFQTQLLYCKPRWKRALSCAGLGHRIPGFFTKPCASCFGQELDREQRGGRRERIPLQHFLRLIAGRAVVADRAHATNDDLINNLRRIGVLSTCAAPLLSWGMSRRL